MGFLTRIGMPPSKSDIRYAADLILARKGEPLVSKEWARRWLKRNRDFYKTTRANTLAAERKAVHTVEDIHHHFEHFKNMIEEYEIRQCDVWNFDEIGFRIGCLRGRIIVV
jgi:hypothetical protein